MLMLSFIRLGFYVLLVHLMTAVSLNINLTSIHVVPELYQLCWRHLQSIQLTSVSQYVKVSPLTNEVFKEDERYPGGNAFCLEIKDATNIYNVTFKLREDKIVDTLNLQVRFFMPLGPHLSVIRTKVVSSGVYFQLKSEFGGVDIKNIKCTVLISYQLESSNRKKIRQFQMLSGDLERFTIKANPGTHFDLYYSCYLPTSTHIIHQQSFFYDKEKTDPLKPLIQFPFRRYIFVQLNSSAIQTKSFLIAVLDVSKRKSHECLKMFRIILQKEKGEEQPDPLPKGCSKSTYTEDIGSHNNSESERLLVMLDMVRPLKIRISYKLSLTWFDDDNNIMENFVYFEPFPNENGGLVHENVLKFSSFSDYEEVRDLLSDLDQKILSDHWDNPINEKLFNGKNIETFAVVPSVSTQPIEWHRWDNTSNFGQLISKCLHMSECSSGLNPFFYVIYTRRVLEKKYVEIISIPKNKVSTMSAVQLQPDSNTYTFTVKWINVNVDDVLPALYVIKMNLGKKCVYLYNLKCRTCNQKYKQMTEENTAFKLQMLIFECEKYRIIEGHYSASSSSISFTTDEMVAEENFVAQIIPFGLLNINEGMSTSAEFIKKRFWTSYGNFIKVILGSGFGILVLVLLVVFGVRFKKRRTKAITNLPVDEQYYEEQEM